MKKAGRLCVHGVCAFVRACVCVCVCVFFLLDSTTLAIASWPVKTRTSLILCVLDRAGRRANEEASDKLALCAC